MRKEAKAKNIADALAKHIGEIACASASALSGSSEGERLAWQLRAAVEFARTQSVDQLARLNDILNGA